MTPESYSSKEESEPEFAEIYEQVEEGLESGRGAEQDLVAHKWELTQLVTTLDNPAHQTEAAGILHEFNKTLGKKLRVLVTALCLSTPVASLADSDQVEQIEAIDTELDTGTSKRAARSLNKLSSKVWTDEAETKHVLFGEVGRERMIAKQKAPDGSYEVNISADKVDRAIYKRMFKAPDKDYRLIIQHNHPAALPINHFGIAPDVIAAMQEGEKENIVAPPSMIDLFMINNFGYGRFDVIGQVSGPSAQWTFNHDETSPVYKIVEESYQAGNQSEGEFDNRLNYILRISDQQIGYIEQKVQSELGFSYQEVFTALWDTAQEIREVSARGESTETQIQLYIELAKQLGIEIDFNKY